MAYSDFTLGQVKKAFDLQINEQIHLFAAVEEQSSSDYLQRTLEENVSIAVAINTEKARSKMMIVPILLEVRRQAAPRASLCSGSEFNVDPNHGLVGFCDYILSHSKEQLTINAPVVTIVEAKNENIKARLGQCIAEMLAAQIFNQRENNAIDRIYGAVTTGEIWKFLMLEGSVIAIDLSDYYIKDVDKILGILAQAFKH